MLITSWFGSVLEFKWLFQINLPYQTSYTIFQKIFCFDWDPPCFGFWVFLTENTLGYSSLSLCCSDFWGKLKRACFILRGSFAIAKSFFKDSVLLQHDSGCVGCQNFIVFNSKNLNFLKVVYKLSLQGFGSHLPKKKN